MAGVTNLWLRERYFLHTQETLHATRNLLRQVTSQPYASHSLKGNKSFTALWYTDLT